MRKGGTQFGSSLYRRYGKSMKTLRSLRLVTCLISIAASLKNKNFSFKLNNRLSLAKN